MERLFPRSCLSILVCRHRPANAYRTPRFAAHARSKDQHNTLPRARVRAHSRRLSCGGSITLRLRLLRVARTIELLQIAHIAQRWPLDARSRRGRAIAASVLDSSTGRRHADAAAGVRRGIDKIGANWCRRAVQAIWTSRCWSWRLRPLALLLGRCV